MLASSWYPAAAVAALEDAIVQEMGGQPAEVCTELGAFSAEQNLPSTYQSFFAMGQSPVAFFQKLISLYPSLYDYGRVWLAKTTRNGTEIQHDFEGHATRTNCLTARSFFERAGSMAGIQDLRVREVCCQASGAAVCVLSAEWEPTPESG
ncbi:MAG TPA: hypothetical protein PKA88_04140 [Polyangiaceae bacterium]|nr:hypothetical protein [Polyangiaceae bacterium]